MFFFTNRSRRASSPPLVDVYPDSTCLGEARRAAMAFALGESGPAPRKPSRATLPDVDFAQACRLPRRSLLERLFGAPRALKNHHKPSSRCA
jgi:hypothetical protein